MRLRVVVLIVVVLLAGVLAARTARPAQAAVVCFPATGQCISGRFLDYWLAHGGVTQQGYPLTGEFIEISATDGQPYTVQYFERARFEAHPENPAPFDVLLGLLGRDQLIARYGSAARRGEVDCASPTGASRVACDAFRAYWQANGGQEQYGLDLTALLTEVNPVNGQAYLVQYYERARFEYHPEAAGTPFAVQLGLIGRERFVATYPQGVPNTTAPLPPAPSSAPALPATPTPIPTPGPLPSQAPSPSLPPTPTPTPRPTPLPGG